jgi:hypothetical protein
VLHSLVNCVTAKSQLVSPALATIDGCSCPSHHTVCLAYSLLSLTSTTILLLQLSLRDALLAKVVGGGRKLCSWEALVEANQYIFFLMIGVYFFLYIYIFNIGRAYGEFGQQELGFLGHCLSKAGVSVDPQKVKSIVKWATQTML